MNETLDELIRKTRDTKMTPQQEKEQRISFVYGNTSLENDAITKELIEEVDAQLNDSTAGSSE